MNPRRTLTLSAVGLFGLLLFDSDIPSRTTLGAMPLSGSALQLALAEGGDL